MDAPRITRSIELEAPADVVWRALTEPELLGEWLGDLVELEVRPGGEGLIVEPDGAVRRALVDEVDCERRLALRWWPQDGDGPESTVELDLESTADGCTRVVVTETVVAPASQSPQASVAAGARWSVRLLLLGCCLLRVTVACGRR